MVPEADYCCTHCGGKVTTASSLGGYLCRRHAVVHTRVMSECDDLDWYPLLMLIELSKEVDDDHI